MRPRVLLLIPLSLAFLVTGCPFGTDLDSHESPSPWPPGNSPENVLLRLERAYAARDSVAYDSLFYDAGANHDTPIAYLFRFWVGDVSMGRVPEPTWDRAREIQATRRIFGADSVKTIELSLTFRRSEPVNISGHESEREIIVDDVSLRITVEENASEEPNFYVVTGDRANFRFRPQWIPASGDTMWRIVYWEDRGHSPGKEAAVMPASWGLIKSRLGD